MKLRILLITVLTFSLSVSAQVIRIGYIDMDYILDNVPEYHEASAELDRRVQKWHIEIDTKMSEVEEMKRTLASEKVLLTQELIDEREEDIYFKEKEVLEYQQGRFGPSGDLVLQKQRLVKPIQDQVFNSVQEIAKTKKYDFVFDKSSDAFMLYSADRYDISDLVLRSITRAAKRVQATNKKQREGIVQDENNTLAQDKELQERQRKLDAEKAAREKLIEEKKIAREKLRQQKIKEYEARRNQLLELRKKKRDSLENLRKK